MAEKHYAHYMTVAQFYNLNLVCRELRRVGFWSGKGPLCSVGIMLVGSVLTRRDWRDVDIRCVLRDEDFDVFAPEMLKFLSVTISEWIGTRTGLPVDFQFQRMTDANKEYPSPEHLRNAIGITD